MARDVSSLPYGPLYRASYNTAAHNSLSLRMTGKRERESMKKKATVYCSLETIAHYSVTMSSPHSKGENLHTSMTARRRESLGLISEAPTILLHSTDIY